MLNYNDLNLRGKLLFWKLFDKLEKEYPNEPKDKIFNRTIKKINDILNMQAEINNDYMNGYMNGYDDADIWND